MAWCTVGTHHHLRQSLLLRAARRQKQAGATCQEGHTALPQAPTMPQPSPPCSKDGHDGGQLIMHRRWDEEAEAQRHEVIFPRSHSQEGEMCYYYSPTQTSVEHLLCARQVPGEDRP